MNPLLLKRSKSLVNQLLANSAMSEIWVNRSVINIAAPAIMPCQKNTKNHIFLNSH